MIAHSVAEQLRLIDRAVTILTRSTEALLRATDEGSLLDEICRIAVEVAGYRLAWVGFARFDPAKSVEVVAHYGPSQAYLSEIDVSWGEGNLGRGPTGTAIRTGMAQVIRHTEEANYEPWRDSARRWGFHSAIALPLTVGDDCLGALNIYSADPDAFDADVIHLLEDMARNLAYGISSLRVRGEHERAVRDLAESEERYRSLVDLSPDAVLVHSQGTILFANPPSARIFGSGDAHALVGRAILDLVDQQDREIVTRRVANPPQGRLVSEYRMRRLDGTPFEAEIVATSITFHGLSARLLVVRDVTERKQVQEQLVQTAKLATLGEMAAGLVHELSQPLNIIRLTAEGALLVIERGKATQEWQEQQFSLIADQAQRTAEIIDDIRIFSRRDTSPVQVFDATHAVKTAIGVLEGQFRPDGITLAIKLPTEPLLVRGRRVQMEQVVMNLMSNAHHALKEKRDEMPAHWRGEVRIDVECENDAVRVTISDNGPGIPEALRARIFEPFFTTKEAGRGTGLGLSVSFGIINAMGGRLEMLNPDEGASFSITLPIDRDATAANDERELIPAAPELAPEDAHILVVDDEKTAAEALGNYLSQLGYRVSVSTSGVDAYELFMTDPADVVITDLRMPAGGGEQLVERLRDFDPLLPIVIVTGHLGATERLAENLQDDRCAVLKKPVALAKLGELICTFLKPPQE